MVSRIAGGFRADITRNGDHCAPDAMPHGGAIVPIACDGEGAAATSCGAFPPFLVSVRTLIKNLHVDYGTFKRITLTLHTCDMIDEERLDARKFIYTLKNAT